MAGCFGSSAYDRYLEGELHRHLAQYDDNVFDITGTVTYRIEGKSVVAKIDEKFETRYEADNEVRDAFIDQFCNDNGVKRDDIEDYDLDLGFHDE